MEEKIVDLQNELQEIESALEGLYTIATCRAQQESYSDLDFQEDCQNICTLAIKKLDKSLACLEEMEVEQYRNEKSV